jgi:hypothetical protein
LGPDRKKTAKIFSRNTICTPFSIWMLGPVRDNEWRMVEALVVIAMEGVLLRRYLTYFPVPNENPKQKSVIILSL